MNLIVAVDEKWGIGRKGELLANIPGDLKYFKEKTIGRVVIMGRKTLESMPNKRGLAKRKNYVLSRNSEFFAERCETVHTEEELSEKLKGTDPDDIFVIGGDSIYRKFYKKCSKCYVTKMYADLKADRFMVNLDEDPDFDLVKESEMHVENGINYRFLVYENRKAMEKRGKIEQ